MNSALQIYDSKASQSKFICDMSSCISDDEEEIEKIKPNVTIEVISELKDEL